MDRSDIMSAIAVAINFDGDEEDLEKLIQTTDMPLEDFGVDIDLLLDELNSFLEEDIPNEVIEELLKGTFKDLVKFCLNI